MRDDVRREAISFLSTVGEAAGALERGERSEFVSSARSTTARMRSCLVVASDLGYLSAVELDALLAQVRQVLDALQQRAGTGQGEAPRAQ